MSASIQVALLPFEAAGIPTTHVHAPAVQAPEVMQGGKPSAASDVYSFGMVSHNPQNRVLPALSICGGIGRLKCISCAAHKRVALLGLP